VGIRAWFAMWSSSPEAKEIRNREIENSHESAIRSVVCVCRDSPPACSLSGSPASGRSKWDRSMRGATP
jgi:hypothetical protein